MTVTSTVAYDWRNEKPSRIVRNINLARKFGKFTDVTFIVGPDEDSCVMKVHRVVVGTASRELAILLLDKAQWIRITDVSPIGFKNLITYLYDTNVEFTDLETARQTHRVADKYKVYKLQLAAESYLTRAVKYEPVLDMLEIAIEFDIPQLQLKCINIISDKYQDVLKSEELVSAPFEVLHTILTYRPCVGEDCQLHALQTIGKWMKKHEAECEENVQDLIKSVDLILIKIEDFQSFVEENPGVLSGDESKAFHKYILSRDVGDAPQWYISETSSEENDDKTSSEALKEDSLENKFLELMEREKLKVGKALKEELRYVKKHMKEAVEVSMDIHKISMDEVITTVVDYFSVVMKEAVEATVESIEDDMTFYMKINKKENEDIAFADEEKENINASTEIAPKPEMDSLSITENCRAKESGTKLKISMHDSRREIAA